MPLSIEFDDGKRWRVCSSRARSRVTLRWTELSHDGVSREEAREIPFERSTTRWLELPVSETKGTLKPVEGERAWSESMTVQAGRFFSRRISFEVAERGDPPRKASIRLIPQVSAVVALGLLVVSLVALAWQTAATLSTLHLNFSYSHAVTGIGGLTLLGLAAKAVQSVTAEFRAHGLPLFGLGYLLGRTMVACVIGAGSIAILLPTCVTTVVNKTEAKIELKLPNSPDRMVLGPDQQITFLGRSEAIEETLRHAFVKPGRYCLFGDPGLLDPISRPYEASKISKTSMVLAAVESCRSESGKAPMASGSRLLEGLFSPSNLRLGCRLSAWQGVRGAQVKPEYNSNAFSTPGQDTLWVNFDDACEPVEGASAVVKLEPPPGEGFSARYEIRHPWTYAQVERAVRVVVEAESRKGMRLHMSAAVVEETEAVGVVSTRGPSLTLDVSPGSGVSAAIPTPFVASTSEVSIQLGSPNGDSMGLVPQGTLNCVRHDAELESHFRLVGLPLTGKRSRVLTLRAGSTASPAWESLWHNLRPESERGVVPRLCVIAPGDGLNKLGAPHSIPARSLSLALQVSFPRFGELLSLRIPAAYAARRIEISAQSDTGLMARGTLTCVPAASEMFVAYEIGPLWVQNWRSEPVHGVVELLIEEEPSIDDEREDTRRRTAWHSRWTTDGARNGNEVSDRWFPPWVCRPVPADAEATRGQVSAQVRSSKWYDADVMLAEGRAKLRAIPPKTCYFDRQTHRKRRSCPHPCEKLGRTRRDRYNRDLSLSCVVIYECAVNGDEC